MARYFDAQAALAEIRTSPIRAIRPISESDTSKNRANRANRVPPDSDSFEERVAIIKYYAELSRCRAENIAIHAHCCDNVVAFRADLHSTQKRERSNHDPIRNVICP